MGSVSLEPLLEQAGFSAQANIFAPCDLRPWSEETAVNCLGALAKSYDIGLTPEVRREMCRRLRCCIPHHVQMFFDRIHDHLRRAGRTDAGLDDVEWVYVRGMQGVWGQVDLQHYEGRLETVLGRTGYTIALEILTATAVDGGINTETVDEYRNHFSTLDTHSEDGTPSFEQVLHVLQHDGYLEPGGDKYQFVSGLLEDWWRGRYGQSFVPLLDRQR